MLSSDMSEMPSSPVDPEPSRRFRVSTPCRGASMAGTLEAGDCLWIVPMPFESLQKGDVVAFHAGGHVLAHRIVARDGRGFRTQGDGNWSRDSVPLTLNNFIGKVEERERRGCRSPVAGGTRGRWKGNLLRTICRLRRHLDFWLMAPFRRRIRSLSAR